MLHSESLFISQSGSGSGTGVDASNRASVSFFNNSSNWGAGAGKISAGDTVSLGGTITGTLAAQGSGTSGNPITILFESGAKSSSAVWGTGASSAIYLSGKSYITVDGGTNGAVENSANGDGLANQAVSRGVTVTGCSNIEVKNLIVRTMFVKTYNSATVLANYSTRGIDVIDSSNVSVNHCTTSDAHTGIFISGTGSVISVNDNIVSACSTAIVLGTDQNMSSITFQRNDIAMGYNWTDPAGNGHNDGIHCWNTGSGVMTTAVEMSANNCHGDPGEHSTGMYYWEGAMDLVYCYNNLGIATNNRCTDGYITCSGANGLRAYIYNNTIKGVGTGSTGGNGVLVYNAAGTYNVTVLNNTFDNCFTGIYNGIGTVAWTCDYNDYHVGSVGVGNGDVFKSTIGSWQSYTGGDTHSFTTDPLLDSNGNITSSSPCYNAGMDASAVLTADRVGTARPQSSAFDVGSMEVVVGGAPAVPSNYRKVRTLAGSGL